MKITLELQNDERDIIRVLPFIKRKISGLQWYILPFLALGCVAMGILFTMYRVGTMTTQDKLFNVVFFPALLIVIGLFFTVATIRRTPGMLRMMAAKHPGLYQPFVLSISEEGIENQTNGAETKHEWKSVKSCYEKLGGLLLLLDSNGFYFIPARKLSQENYLLVRKIVSEKVGISQE